MRVELPWTHHSEPITTAVLPDTFHPFGVLLSIAALNPKLSVLYPNVLPLGWKTIVLTASISRAVSSTLSKTDRHVSLCGKVRFKPAIPKL